MVQNEGKCEFSSMQTTKTMSSFNIVTNNCILFLQTPLKQIDLRKCSPCQFSFSLFTHSFLNANSIWGQEIKRRKGTYESAAFSFRLKVESLHSLHRHRALNFIQWLYSWSFLFSLVDKIDFNPIPSNEIQWDGSRSIFQSWRIYKRKRWAFQRAPGGIVELCVCSSRVLR